MSQYVQVVVNVSGIEGLFDYHVPEDLSAGLKVGSLVLVPFGRQIVQGIISCFVEVPQVPKTRAIDSVLSEQPVITEPQQQLAAWMANETLSSLSSCYQLMLTPGLSQQADRQYSITDIVPNFPLSPMQKRIVQYLQEKGAQRGRQLEKAFKRQHWKESMRGLVRQGMVKNEAFLPAPRVQAKMVRTIHLACRAEEVPGKLDALSKKTGKADERRRAVMEFVLKEPMGVVIPVVNAISGAQPGDYQRLVEAGLLRFGETEIIRDPLDRLEGIIHYPPELTNEQQAAWKIISLQIEKSHWEKPILLHGVTGSGKTELYLRAVQQVLEVGKSALILVPEISLTPQTVQRFQARFPGRVGIIHSKLSDGERFDTWRRVRSGDLSVIVGPRSALFAPFQKLGLIVIDEAHDDSYFQDDLEPRYSALRAARAYSRICQSVIIYGSATPGIELMYQAKQENWPLLSLPGRVLAHRKAVTLQIEVGHLETDGEAAYLPLPNVSVVDMRTELKEGNRSIFSRKLKETLQATLAAGHQAMLFLNRRGSATYVFCRSCGSRLNCPRCDLSLTFHGDENLLICHHCNYKRQMPKKCPQCQSVQIRQFGTGTERVEQEVLKQFPEARVIRMDSGVTRLKGSHELLLKQFANRQADILVGTQMVAKGIDLPFVTFVGVVLADVGLGLPDFRAAERSFQILTQVAGRAGRSPLGGSVVFQTYVPDEYAIQKASRHDFWGFYTQELALRKKLGYPPYSRLIRLEFRHSKEDQARLMAERMAEKLGFWIQAGKFRQSDWIGPVPCFYQRLDGIYRWQIILRGPKPVDIIRDQDLGEAIVTVDPVSLL
jgi:primosomal protein N' (replication factor Y)